MQKNRIAPVSDHPPYSPDLNPIENLFSVVLSELDRQFVANGPAKSVDDMVERFRAACQLETDKSFIENTVRGMPEQMKKLIEREGGPTGK